MCKIIDKYFFKNLKLEKLKLFLDSEKIKYPNKIKKRDLVPLITDLLKDNLLMERFHEHFKSELALTPKDLEEKLQCTKTEKIRWTNEKKLPVVCYEEFHKAGKNLKAPKFNRLYICTKISESDITEWRKEHSEKMTTTKKASVVKMKVTRLKTETLRNDFKIIFQKELKNLKAKNEELAVVFNLSFCTQLLNRWAKTNQLKSSNQTKHSEKYSKLTTYYYELKNSSLQILLNSQYSKLYFYRPKRPDKINIKFCDYHYSILKYGFYIPDNEDFYYESYIAIPLPTKVGRFLAKILIESELLNDYSFSFHTPYPIGKSFFPNKVLLQETKHKENEEDMFRFGRPVTELETILYTEKSTLKNFMNSLTEAQNFFNSHTTH